MKVDFLPIGSVVLLEGGTKTLMVTGYKMKETPEDEKVYDYVGCVFPEGFMEQVYALFDSRQIKDVLFVGCMDGSEDYLRNIQNGITNAPIAAAPEDGDLFNIPDRKPRKAAPTKPLSASEMFAKYTKEVISGGEKEKFELSDLDDSDLMIDDE